MLSETAEQKERRIFEVYKNRLLVNAGYGKDDWTRFCVIQYLCYFPKIDPYKMAVALAEYGVKILFDNSAISKAENEQQERKFYRLLRAEQSTNKKAR